MNRLNNLHMQIVLFKVRKIIVEQIKHCGPNSLTYVTTLKQIFNVRTQTLGIRVG